MRCVPRYLLEKVIKKAVVEGEKKRLPAIRFIFPAENLSAAVLKACVMWQRYPTSKNCKRRCSNKNVREIYVYRDRDLDRRNLTRILEENDLGKTIYCGFNFDS